MTKPAAETATTPTPRRSRNYPYVNNTDIVITDQMHASIMRGVAAGGVLCEELADLLSLRLSPVKNDDGSDRWLLGWA